MRNTLSIKINEEKLEVNINRSDIAASLVRGIVGAAPVLGPMISEVITTVIPNQKLDRLIAFVKVLEDKLGYLEDDLKENITSEEFTDLLEDALPQAARALSEERLKYIANLLENSLSSEELDHLENKKIVAILGELNDAEVLLLYFYSLHQQFDKEEQEEMICRYPFVDDVSRSYLTNDRLDKGILSYSYKQQLLNNNLIRELPRDAGEKYPITPAPVRPTSLGYLLLLRIGLTWQWRERAARKISLEQFFEEILAHRWKHYLLLDSLRKTLLGEIREAFYTARKTCASDEEAKADVLKMFGNEEPPLQSEHSRVDESGRVIIGELPDFLRT